MQTENNITENMRAKLEVWDYPLSDMYTKIWQKFEKMKAKRNEQKDREKPCKKCPNGQEMCSVGYVNNNCTLSNECPSKDCMPFSMEEALEQIRATPERPRSDNQGFALIADATDAR